MSEEERLDIVTVSDESGRELLLTVEKYFYYNGQEYVHLRLVQDGAEPQEDQDYVMLVEVSRDEEGEEVEDFIPLEREQMDSLIQSILINYAAPVEDEA